MDRYNKSKIVGILGIVGNIFLLAIKFIIGIMTKSQAMLSDALNSAGDIISSVMTFIGSKIASKGADEDHDLGHGKAEYVFSLLISLTMIILPVEIFLNSMTSIINKNSYSYSNMLIVVCIVTIIVKFSLYIYTSSIAKKENNLLIFANSKDHRNDCLLTTANLIAQIFAMNSIYYVDGIVGMGVSVFIIITGLGIFKDSYDVLMDKSMNKKAKEKIMQIVKKYPEIVKTNHFNTTPVGYMYQISLTIFVDGNMSTFESHEIANKLEKEITKLDEVYLCIIHVNPIDVSKTK